MDKVNAEIYEQDRDRYIIVSGHREGAPRCSVGNVFEWVGYDEKEKKYVRFTKSVFKRLVSAKERPTG